MRLAVFVTPNGVERVLPSGGFEDAEADMEFYREIRAAIEELDRAIRSRKDRAANGVMIALS